MRTERQLTFAPHGHILSNAAVWSCDGRWIVYDVRSNSMGAVFDGTRIERVRVTSGKIEILHESRNGACCGIVTCSPVDERVVFTHGPEYPTDDWQYSACHRHGMLWPQRQPLDARDLISPFTPGALRGGSHLHLFNDAGDRISFTYEDHLLADGQRNIGVTALNLPVQVRGRHPRNHDGLGFSVLVTKTVAEPTPGSDEISRASEEAWIGPTGRAIAFAGEVRARDGRKIPEVFVVDLPDDLTVSGEGALQGTEDERPHPPRGVVQRRLTFTADRRHPGLATPRHWVRSDRQGTRIAFLMKDDAGIAQLCTVPVAGGPPAQLTANPWPIASAFTWSPDGRSIAAVCDNSVFQIDVTTGRCERLTERFDDAQAPSTLACVFSPNGGQIAYLRPVESPDGRRFNQIFLI